MNTCHQYCSKSLFGLLTASLLFISLFAVQSFVNVGHAAEQPVSLTAPTQVAWYWGPGYQRGYYERHYWGGWYRGPHGCQQRCFHNRYTGAIARCERICE